MIGALFKRISYALGCRVANELPLGFRTIGCPFTSLCRSGLDAECSQLGRERFAPGTQRGAARHALLGARIGE
jgi:hypothetical protein